MPKKLEVSYDRRIYEQLEETLLQVEKLRKEIVALKSSHRQEKYLLNENHAKTVKEIMFPQKEELRQLKVTVKEQSAELAELRSKDTIQRANKLAAEMAELKNTHRREVDLINESHRQTIKEMAYSHKTEIRELQETIREQTSEIAKLKVANAALRAVVEKNSSNSSKPPSSDGYKKIQNSRKPTGKKLGGQHGHKGCEPKFYDSPNEIIEVKAKKCRCGCKLWYTSGTYKKKQFVDIEIKTHVIEYHEYTGFCSCCGCNTVNRSPLKDSITYGNNLKSFSNILSVEGNISINRIRQMLAELSGGQINLSEGTICKWNKDLHKLLAPSIQKLKERLLMSSVLHKDETCIRTDKSTNWFHVLSNDQYTLYYADKKRGKDADIEANVLPAFKGVLVHDNWKSLYHFTCTHAECNAHILRYLNGVVESNNRRWARDMIEFLLYAKEKSESTSLKPFEIEELHLLYDDILELGQAEFARNELPDYTGDDIRLFRRLKDYKSQHLLFLSDRNVPFDNNQAERDLRMIKAKTKISGCFRSADGDNIFAAVKSYTSSLRKNKLNIFNGIIQAWENNPVLF